jgi:uncharacterized protein
LWAFADRLKVTVSRPPERGAANRAVLALVAELLGVAARDVELAGGATRAEKLLRIRGLPAAEVRRRIANKIEP